MMEVYLDNGATTKVDPRAVDVMISFMLKDYGNPSSVHSLGQNAEEHLEKARETIALKVNAKRDEIIFTSGGTESDNLAIRGVAHKKGSGHIITSKIEHPAVLNTCKRLENEGFSVTYLGVDKEGFIDIKELEDAITDKTILISIMHVNNEIGVIQDLESIGRIAKEKGVIFHSDTVQSFTKVPIDVEKMNLSMASFASHKIHGPKGVGALYIKKGIGIDKLLYGGHQEKDLRPGTQNMPAIMGFAKAAELMTDDDLARMQKLRDRLAEGILDEVKDCFLNGSKDKRSVNNVNISFRYIEGESILLHLDMHGISVSTGSACSSQSLRPSHVLTALGLKAEEAHGSVRFTLSRFTTEAEIDHTIEAVRSVIPDLRKMSPLKKGMEDMKWDEVDHDHA
ncbi:cysteine desulfurase NifS [Candidatus Woesearchaeota archaeon CG11_big_fil_rev_8_21_14_0_20_43_8]|nr:MAG: cysteine desulfurase NifS [Candidatus Woesearchaeota archaeon CG11_big_fil_rev_8_21_14_0_20_43_8]